MPSSRPDAPNAPHGPNAPHNGPNAPSGPNTPHGLNTPSRPDAPHGGPNTPSRPDAPHGGPNSPSRPDAPHRPDGSGPGNRPDGSRPDGSRPHSPQSPQGPHSPDAPRSRGTDTAAPPHRPDADAPHKPDAPHGPDADKPHDHTPDKPHDGDAPDSPNGHDPDAPPADRPSPAEAHARHAESTPAGVSHHGGDADMGDLPHRVPNDPRYFTADVHITPDGHARIGGHDYTPAEYADMLRSGGYDGSRPVRLIGCDAGSNDFAQQLSRHLDAPVLAPTKPAWTDSHGRVFTSDPEILPDGTRQPRIPPNGEWETHLPDGSRSRTGDDGFAPGTHDRDVDPSDARDRMAQRQIPDSPVEIETRNPPALMEEKLKDKDFRDKYYDGPNSNGEYSRKNANQVDANGDDVPKLVENPKGSGNFEASSDAYTPARFREDLPEVKHDATPEQKAAAQDIISRREASLERTNTAEGNYQREIAGDRDASQPTVDERRAAHDERTKVGEELGEHAAADAVRDTYPPKDYDVTPVHDPNVSGSGRFDQVYEVHNRETGETRLVIVEAKGPNADLGTRRYDGENYQQGHPKYVQSVIDNMRDNGTDVEKELAKRLEKAMGKGQLDFNVVKAKVSGSGDAAEYGGYSQKHFDLNMD
jgi:hypothetical protein